MWVALPWIALAILLTVLTQVGCAIPKKAAKPSPRVPDEQSLVVPFAQGAYVLDYENLMCYVRLTSRSGFAVLTWDDCKWILKRYDPRIAEPEPLFNLESAPRGPTTQNEAPGERL